MATYSPNLAITLPADGEFSGTWGQTTNTNLGTLLEQAISGYETQPMAAAADVTLSLSNGAYSMCRNMYIECTGIMSQVNSLIVPNNKKLYFIYNNTTGGSGYAITVKTALGSSVSVPNGAKMVLVCNGSGIIEAINNVNFTNLSITGLTASGNVTAAAFIPTGSTVPTNGVYLPSANYLGFASNTTARGGINSSGAWIFNAPSVGAHIVNILAGSNGVTFSTPAHSFLIYSDNSTFFGIGTTTTIPVRFLCNNVVVGTVATTGGWSIAVPTSGVALTVNGVAGTHSTQIADNNNSKFDAGYLGIPQNAQTSAYVLTHQDRGKHISITTGGVTLNAVPFLVGLSGTTANWSVGDSFVIYNNSSSNQTITAGTNVTTRLAGTATTGTGAAGNRTLAQYGVATFLCVVGTANPTFVVSGAGVS